MHEEYREGDGNRLTGNRNMPSIYINDGRWVPLHTQDMQDIDRQTRRLCSNEDLIVEILYVTEGHCPGMYN